MIGKTISHYRILNELGRGGMGVVYEAEDTLLGRRAALKFLPEEVAHDSQSLARFQREARAASALNHPNICTIYEIGEGEKRWFIAMELLEGMTLDRSLTSTPLPLQKLLDWGIQVSDALDAAHAKGIVHRDLKPSNIFLTKRGQLKVLDFGLAKMADPEFDAAGVTSPGLTVDPAPLTSPGLAIGTVAFMSPEQARGGDLDARSDLFSFGTMLYLMATGRMPFEGKTSAMVFDAILNREAAPVSEVNADAPPELQRIVGKCLEKDADLRYQHASELRSDLKRLKRDSGSVEARAKTASGQSVPQTSAAVTSSESRSLPHSTPLPLSGKSRLGSSDIVAAASKHGVGSVLGSVIAMAVLVAAAFGVYELLHRSNRAPFQNMEITRLTSSGANWAAALSPDGKYLASLQREADGRDGLWMRHLSTNSNTQIVPPGDAAIDDATFSPDGDYVYYRSHPSASTTYDLYRVPVLGGQSVRVIHNIDSAPSFSASTGRFCFLRYRQSVNSQSLISADPEGSGEKVIYAGKGITFTTPAWSPDGKRIIAAEYSGGTQSVLTMLDPATGTSSHFATLPKPIFEPDHLAWMPDGRGIIVMYRDIDLAMRQLAYISYPAGDFHQITNDLNRYGAVSLSGDGKTLATVMSSTDEMLDVFPANPRNISDTGSTSLGSGYWLDWVNDDELVSTRIDNLGIDLLSATSGKRTTLFSGNDLRIYDIARCGPKSAVFTGAVAAKGDESHIYAIDFAGGAPRQITTGKADQYMRCTPDGNWLIYHSFENNGIYKMPVQGGEAKLLVSGERHPFVLFSVTPDGKDLVVILSVAGDGGTDHSEFEFVSLDNGEVTKRLPAAAGAASAMISPDGKNIAFRLHEHGVDNVWLQPVAGGNATRLTDFHLTGATSQSISGSVWSPDGKRIAIARRFFKGDVILLHDQEK